MPNIQVRDNDLIATLMDIIVDGQVAREMIEYRQMKPWLVENFAVTDDEFQAIIEEYRRNQPRLGGPLSE